MRAALMCFATALVAMLIVPSAYAQSANVAVSDWNALCFATRGATGEAFARADTAGWSVLPQGEGRYLDGVTGRRVLLFTDQPDRGTRMCMTSSPSHEMNVWSEVQTVLGGPPTHRDGLASVWILDNTGAGWEILTNDETERAREAFATRRAVIVRATVERGLDVVMSQFTPEP